MMEPFEPAGSSSTYGSQERPTALALSFLEQARDAVAIFTVEESLFTSRIVFTNRAMRRRLGVSEDRLVGHGAALLLGARPSEEEVTEIFTASAPRRRRRVRTDGAVHDVETTTMPIRDADGVVTHMALIERDVVARPSQAEDDARLLIEERFTSYRQVAAGAAYRLERPLARLRSTLHAEIASQGDDPEELRDAARAALRSAEDVDAVARGLMAFAGREGPAQPVDVHEAIDVAIRLTQREIDARARLVRRFAAVPAVRASIPQLSQVLVAILRNAAESIPRFLPVANSIIVTTEEDLDGRVVIEVTDTGVGIEDEDLPRVFEPFFSTKVESDALGLGLTAARAAVLKMGGTIDIETVVGRGTRCRILLPADVEFPHRSLPLFTSDLPGRRVLAIAEDPEIGRRFAELFEDDHTMVKVMPDDEALESLSLGESWDLVVCDARDAKDARLRERIGNIAPEIVSRLFEMPVARKQSGIHLVQRTTPTPTVRTDLLGRDGFAVSR